MPTQHHLPSNRDPTIRTCLIEVWDLRSGFPGPGRSKKEGDVEAHRQIFFVKPRYRVPPQQCNERFSVEPLMACTKTVNNSRIWVKLYNLSNPIYDISSTDSNAVASADSGERHGVTYPDNTKEIYGSAGEII